MEGRGGQVELSEVSQDCNSDQRSGRARFSLEYALFVRTRHHSSPTVSSSVSESMKDEAAAAVTPVI